MRHFQRFVFSGLLAVFMATTSLAGDFAQLKFIGFSTDGKYLVFTESGGGGEAEQYEYERTYFVETAKNTFAAAPAIFQFDDSMSAKSKRALISRFKKNVAGKMKRFGIVRGNIGQLVAAHLLNDWSYVKPVESERVLGMGADGAYIKKMMPDYEGAYAAHNCGGTEKVIFNPELSDFAPNTTQFYELTLTSGLAKDAKNAGACKIELTLKDNTRQREVPLQILQKDGDELPAGRQQAFGYKIEQVYVYQNKIAVFLNVFSPGFEGPEMHYMVVTGAIPY